MRTTTAVTLATLAIFGLAGVWAIAADGPALTRDNWGAQVGFAPEVPAELAPERTIDAANAAGHVAWLSEATRLMIAKYGMKITTAPYEAYAPSDGYIGATNRFRGKASLKVIGDATSEREIEGYEGGLPFPAPRDGREVAWNYTLGYAGDDSESEFKVLWISGKRGVERTEEWKTITVHRAKFRTDVAPLPEIPALVKNGVIAATLSTALRPPDKKGFASLYFGYLEPREPEGWLYVPAQRRSIRLTFGTRGESWNSTDLLYEDVRGYTGSPEWMDWRIVDRKTLLAPVHAGVVTGAGHEREAFDLDTAPHWNPRMKWEPRPVYVVEATPRFKRYPYARMVFTIDAESFHILTKEAYDRKGQLWKILINASNSSPDPATQPMRVALSLVVDTQADHATAFFWHSQKSNQGVDPGLFSLTSLRKFGR